MDRNSSLAGPAAPWVEDSICTRLSSEQYLKGKRGSVYVRTDGRVFDYSVDRNDPGGDLFDTGYTIYDLERTGRYAPALRRRRARKKSQPPKVRRAGAGG